MRAVRSGPSAPVAGSPQGRTAGEVARPPVAVMGLCATVPAAPAEAFLRQAAPPTPGQPAP
jgi:hypothetical protein